MTKKENGQESASLEIDSFWLSAVYPDAAASLDFYQAPVEDVKDETIIVLDANVLLLPYRLGAQSLDEIRKVFSQLAENDRIFLPAQAVREFLKNRAGRVRDALRELERQASQIQIMSDRRIGFLESDKDYNDLMKSSEEIRELKKKSLSSISRISSNLKRGIGNDPVSEAYRNIFKDKVVDIDCKSDEEKKKVVQDMAWRYAHGIPPGYKDQSKGDGGIGDFLIWKTVLKLGEDRKAHCIFVTEDSKGDWWVQSEGTFQPRIELAEEYRRATDGKTIHLMPLSSFLSVFGAEAQAVDETQKVEIQQRERQRAIEIHLESIEQDNSSISPVLPLSLSSENEVVDDNIRSLMKINSQLSKQIKELSLRQMRLRQRLQHSDISENATDREISEMFREKETLDVDLRNLFRERRRIEEEIKRAFS